MPTTPSIQCSACGEPNSEGRKFCGECGGALAATCPGCGTTNPPGIKFCGECGSALGGAAASPAPASSLSASSSTSIGGSLPSTFAGGRYQVKRFIGEGAKKRVYLATDSRLESEVAFALINTQGLDADGHTRVQREIQAMGRLRDHPHIVPVFDVGEENGRAYIVSQYMSGGDVDAYLAKHTDRRLPIDDAMRLCDEIAQALEHAHTNGVIHRDLKPGNVWLTEENTAKLGDFGLAIATDRSRLTQEGTIVGTVAYMPPEQALGKQPDSRSDLYALGAMLYEMVTGRPPFIGDDSVAIISQHINTSPVAPSWHNAEVSPPLERLILGLLAKDPQARPATASDVRLAIAAVSGAPAAAAEPAAAGNALDRLAGDVFVGRDTELTKLRSGVDAALARPGRVLMLVGEPGIGKTRTAQEVVTYARMRGAQVLWGRCYEGEGAPAFWPWRQIVREYVHERDPKELMSEMGAGAADIADVVSEVRDCLPGLPVAPTLEPEQARFRLFDSLGTFLRNASNQNPLVIVLDDLHWADKPSLQLLQFVARELAEMRILVLGTYRDVELSRQHPLAETLAELTRSQLCERVLLRGLQEDDVARFVELSSGSSAPHALVEAIYRETEGNPFFVTEVVRLLESDGRLGKAAEIGSWSVEIPQGVREVIGRRLNGLSDECNRVLTLASVLGREFDLAELEGISELGSDALLEIIETTVAARVVEEDGDTHERYRFAHALIRETLYEELSTTRRIRLHRKAGEALEAIHADALDSQVAALAYHFGEGAPGGDVDKAVHYAIRAAERALLSHANEERAAHFERAIQAFELQRDVDPWARCVLYIGLAHSQLAAGSMANARATEQRAVAMARELGDGEKLGAVLVQCRVLLEASGTFDPEITGAVHEALQGIPDEDSALRAQLLSLYGVLHFFTEEQELLENFTRDGLAMARRVGDHTTLMASLWYRSIVVGKRDPAAHRELADERLAMAEAAGDPLAIHDAHQQCASPALALGDMEAYHRHGREGERLASELRLRGTGYAWVLQRSCCAIFEGRFEEAETIAQECLAEGNRTGTQILVQAYGAQMSSLRRLQGRSAELTPMIESLVAQYPALPGFRSALARAYAEEGRVEEARSELQVLAANDYEATLADAGWLTTVAVLVEVAHAVDDRDAAERFHALMLPYEDLFVTTQSILNSGPVARYLGVAAETLERWDLADAHYERAMELGRRIGARAHIATTLANRGRMLLRQGRAEDRERALSLVNEALEEARELGMNGLLQETLALKLGAQGADSADTQSSIYSVASSVQRKRPDLKPAAAADGTVTIMFSDIEGFTSMTERLGDVAAHRVVGQHNAIVREQLALHAGHELELQGDGFLLAFANPLDGLRCAVGVQRAFSAHNERDSEESIRVRIGLHSGEAIADAEKFFGLTVIVAARIAAQAKADEILVSATLAESASGTEIELVEEQMLDLKGISEPQRAMRVLW